jgi:hypothetical protein
MNLTPILAILKDPIAEVYIHRLTVPFGPLLRMPVKEEGLPRDVILAYRICPNCMYVLQISVSKDLVPDSGHVECQ